MPKIPIARPHIDAKDEKGVLKVLRSGVLSLGPKYQEFEQGICAYTKAKYACAVSNGTCGLHLAVRALDLQAGDEVITSPFSFVASANCLLFEGVKPVFVDIDPTTFNMDPTQIERKITKRTRAILVVHIFGQSAQMDAIMKIARKYKLKVIEDACESLGATWKGKMTGTFGDIGVFAFYPNKQMTTGEGGIIVTNSAKYYQLCNSMRNQGRNVHNDWLVHERLGYNYRMDEMSASLGVTQLKKLDWMVDKKRRVISWYEKQLSSVENIMLPQIGDHRTHTWFVYVIRVLNGKRNALMKVLAEQGIQTKPYLPVIHLQPYMVERFGFKPGDFPIAEEIASQTLALPLFIGLKKSDIQTIAQIIRQSV